MKKPAYKIEKTESEYAARGFFYGVYQAQTGRGKHPVMMAAFDYKKDAKIWAEKFAV